MAAKYFGAFCAGLPKGFRRLFGAFTTINYSSGLMPSAWAASSWFILALKSAIWI